MTQLKVQRKYFLAYRSATAFLLSRVASKSIQSLILFWSTWLCETFFSQCSEKTPLAVRARRNKMQQKLYYSVFFGCQNRVLFNRVNCLKSVFCLISFYKRMKITYIYFNKILKKKRVCAVTFGCKMGRGVKKG